MTSDVQAGLSPSPGVVVGVGNGWCRAADESAQSLVGVEVVRQGGAVAGDGVDEVVDVVAEDVGVACRAFRSGNGVSAPELVVGVAAGRGPIGTVVGAVEVCCGCKARVAGRERILCAVRVGVVGVRVGELYAERAARVE